MTQNNRMSLTSRIFIGLVSGLIIGYIFKLFGDSVYDLGFTEIAPRMAAADLFHIGGKIFVNCLKMMVVPLVFVSLVCGICSLSDTSKLGRLGTKAISLYIITTAIAITTTATAITTIAIASSGGEGGAIVNHVRVR